MPQVRSTTIPILILWSSLFAVHSLSWCGSSYSAEDKTEKDSVDKDYRSELPRIPATKPANALKTFRALPGFKIQLVASEPLIRDPVAIDFDDYGRMFVCEMPEYNQYANEEFKDIGAVKLLEDTNGDGRFDKATTFLDKVSSPTSVACYNGGVFVGSVPDILFCKDNDGDGKADVRRKIFTGFARDKAGEAMLNSFRWGFENRFFISTSLAGGDVRSATKKDEKATSVRGRGFIFDPRTETFELTSGGGQHGMSRDDWGRRFVCSNSVPAQTLMYDDRYVARNPYMSAPAAAINIVPGNKYAKVFRISPNEPWRILRTRLRKKKLIPGSDEGGTPSGFFTAATGVTIYRGDAFPPGYYGNMFVAEAASNVIFRAKLKPNGIELIANRADPNVEFLASTDNWFRPVQLSNAPDGCLYAIDFYRELIEGAAFIAPPILKHMDVAAGMNRGRIYRIVPVWFKQPPPPRLAEKSSAELATLLEHHNGWTRDTASRLLYERQDSSVVKLLTWMATNSRSAQGRTYAMFSLDGLGELSAELVLTMLKDRDANVRIQAMRLAEKLAESPIIRARVVELASDEDINVRYQAAFSLGAFSGSLRNTTLAKLAVRDVGDKWMRLAIQSSLNRGVEDVFQKLVIDEQFRKTANGQNLLKTLATQVGTANRANEVAGVLKSLNDLPSAQKPLAQSLIASLVAKQPKGRLKSAIDGKAAEILSAMLKESHTIAFDVKRSERERAGAIRTLGLMEFAKLQDSYGELLSSRQPNAVQQAALETLSRFSNAGVATVILKNWSGLSPRLRSNAVETLFSRTEWIAALLDSVKTGKVRPGELDPVRIKLLQSHRDKSIRERAERLFVAQRLSKRKDVVDQYQKALSTSGDAANGKMVFKKDCSACHKLEGVGNFIGADLKAIRNRGLDAVLLNILDPNREVKPQYVSYIVVTDDGRTHTGMITTENANSITLRRNDATNITILRINIEELRSTGISFMPEGLEKQIDVKAMADLLAYLNSIK